MMSLEIGILHCFKNVNNFIKLLFFFFIDYNIQANQENIIQEGNSQECISEELGDTNGYGT